MKRLTPLILILSLITSFALPTSVSSAQCSDATKIFSSSYSVEFSFNTNGTSTITQKVSLKNLVDGCFASSYSLKINSPNVKDVSGKDSLGELSISLKKDKSTSTISAKLNDEVIGKNKSVSFELNYKIDGLATKNGLVWDLIVPAIATSEKVISYNLTILIPSQYGKVFAIAPNAKDIVYGKSKHRLTFDKNSSFGKSIFVSFGNEQQISFKLNVPLENNGFFTKSFSVYLPPETQKQQILFTKLEPKPEKIFRDEVGNFVAKYNVRGRGQLEARIEGIARIVGKGNKYDFPDRVSEKELKKYLKGGKFVTPQDILIQEKAAELKTVGKIYDFVVSFLRYDNKALEKSKEKRKTASNLLKNAPETTNQGFVDLFTSLTKATGIATRQVYGFAIANENSFQPIFVSSPLNTNKLHVWAQIYDKKNKIWVNYDPTWGNTVGVDYASSNVADRIGYFYSNNGDDIPSLKDLTVTAENIKIDQVERRVDFTPDIELSIVSDQAFAGFPAELEVTIKNKNGLTLYGSQINVKTKGVDLIDSSSKDIPLIFPFETKKISFKLRSGDIFNSRQGEITAQLKAKSGAIDIEETQTKRVKVQALFSFGTQQILLLIVVALLVVGIFVPRIIKSIRKSPQE